MRTGEGVTVQLVVPQRPPVTTVTTVSTPPAPAPAPLPRTGVELVFLLLLALVLLALGALLVHRTTTRRSA